MGPGIRPDLCRIRVGARYAIVVMLFDLSVWMDQNEKELKRARENMDPLQTGENM